jgi:outer membrane protein
LYIVLETLQASLAAQLTVPIYQGGAEYAAIRQAKETLGQRGVASARGFLLL